jgi:hypothetical protein
MSDTNPLTRKELYQTFEEFRNKQQRLGNDIIFFEEKVVYTPPSFSRIVGYTLLNYFFGR